MAFSIGKTTTATSGLRSIYEKILKEIITFPTTDNSFVIPKESPTVPNADTASKNTSKNVNVNEFSETNNPNTAIVTTKILIINMHMKSLISIHQVDILIM
mgnify:CR=1 FL=1